MGRAGSTSRSSGGRSGSGGSSRSSFSSSSSRNHSSFSRSSSNNHGGSGHSPGWYTAMQTKPPRPEPPRHREAPPPPIYRSAPVHREVPPLPSRHREAPPPVYREVPQSGTSVSVEPVSGYQQGSRHYEEEIWHAQRRQQKHILMIVIALILVVFAFLIGVIANQHFEKAELKGTKSVGYVKDDGFLKGSYRTEEALEEFYEKTGIPLFLYTIADYQADSSTCDAYAEGLYDTLFTDENHALLVYYDNVDWWSWVAGNAVAVKMTDRTFNSLVDAFYYYWEQDITNDEVFAKGITRFTNELTDERSSRIGKFLSAALRVAAAGMLLCGGIFYLMDTRKIIDARDALEHLEVERVLSTPLEKFDDSGLSDLKEKYQ